MTRLESLLENVFDGRWQEAATAASFQNVEGWDSLTYVRLVLAVQAEYAVELSADEIQNVLSLEGLRAVLSSRGIEG